MIRLGLRTLLCETATIQIVGEAATIVTVVTEALRLRPDVVLMDLRFPDGSGIDACRKIRASCPETRILFFTSFSDDNAVVSAFRAGASGFLLKETSGQELTRAIEMIARGQSILDPALTLRMLAHVCTLSVSSSTNNCAKLSAQEKRVLERVVEGKTNKEIAVLLGLSDKTVKSCLSNAYEKLHVHRRAEATACFLRHSRGTVSPSLPDLECPLSAPPPR